MYRDRIAEHGGSKVAARRHVGEFLGIAPATWRNWIEAAERNDAPTTSEPGGNGSTSTRYVDCAKRTPNYAGPMIFEDRELRFNGSTQHTRPGCGNRGTCEAGY